MNNNQQFDEQKSNNTTNNNANSYLFESTSSYSFFMKNQTPNFNDDYVFKHNRTGYSFTDSMLNYNFSNNQNPFAQNYKSKIDRKSNNNNNQTSSNNSSTNDNSKRDIE